MPGNGALADREALLKYHDMVVTVRDRVQMLKAAGRTGKEAGAAKPTADLEAAWVQGFVRARRVRERCPQHTLAAGRSEVHIGVPGRSTVW